MKGTKMQQRDRERRRKKKREGGVLSHALRVEVMFCTRSLTL